MLQIQHRIHATISRIRFYQQTHIDIAIFSSQTGHCGANHKKTVAMQNFLQANYVKHTAFSTKEEKNSHFITNYLEIAFHKTKTLISKKILLDVKDICSK